MLGSSLLPLLGCRPSSPFPIAPVSGTIANADGTPIDALQVNVVFIPQVSIEGTTGRPNGARARLIPPETRFDLTTFENGDGAAIGTNKVAVEVIAKDHRITHPKVALSSDAQPISTVEVKSGRNRFDFKILK